MLVDETQSVFAGSEHLQLVVLPMLAQRDVEQLYIGNIVIYK